MKEGGHFNKILFEHVCDLRNIPMFVHVLANDWMVCLSTGLMPKSDI